MDKTFWVEVRISYDGPADDGTNARLTESWLVRAASFAEAETRAIEELNKQCVAEGVEVEACTKRNIAAVWVEGKTKDTGKFFKARIEGVTVNEKTGREKRVKRDYLIFVDDFAAALPALQKCMYDTMFDKYEVTCIQSTPITEVISIMHTNQ